MSEPIVLFFSRDPGATNQLVAVHELLCQQAAPKTSAIDTLRRLLKLSGDAVPRAVIAGKKYALETWRAAGIEAGDAEGTAPAVVLDRHA